MNGAVPLLRAASSTCQQQSCSRIPHLRVHLLQRQTRPSTPLTRHGTACPAPRRSQHGKAGGASRRNNIIRPLSTRPVKPDSRPPSIHGFIVEGHPERILAGLCNPKIGSSFITEADDHAFARAVCALDPEYFIEPFKPVVQHRRPPLGAERFVNRMKGLHPRYTSFLDTVDSIVMKRKDAGHSLGLDVYRHLLKCAASLGDTDLAENIWTNLMPEENIVPDLQCYNYFLGAAAWENAFGGNLKAELRVTAKHLALRSRPRTRYTPLAGHRTSPPDSPFSNPQGVRLVALEKFKELITQGLAGDETTFVHMMTAMARERDLAGVKSILKSVWNIDVDQLGKYDEDEVQSPTFYEENSPLRPTEQLLFAIVHIFGTNNDVGLASSLLDYVSRSYNLPIPPSVWMHLYEWTYVLCRRRNSSEVRAGYATGKILPRTLERVLKVMTTEPHSVERNVSALTFASANRRLMRHWEISVEFLRESEQLLEEERTQLSILYDEMMKLVNEPKLIWQRDGFVSANFLTLRRQFVLQALQVERDLELIRYGVKNAMQEDDFKGSGQLSSWSTRVLPKLIEDHIQYMPPKLVYQTPSGWVELHCYMHVQDAIHSANGHQMVKVSILMDAVDTNSSSKLLKIIQDPEKDLTGTTRSCLWCEGGKHPPEECPHKEALLAGDLTNAPVFFKNRTGLRRHSDGLAGEKTKSEGLAVLQKVHEQPCTYDPFPTEALQSAQ